LIFKLAKSIIKYVSFLLILGGIVLPQVTDEILEVETLLSTNGVPPGEKFEAAIVINLKENWHINSANPLDEYLIPTEVQFEENENIKVDNIIYPEHVLKNLPFSDKPLALYESEVIVLLEGNLSKNAQDSVILRGNLKYQGCNNETCLPPQTMGFSILIPVIDESTPLQFINSEYFNDILPLEEYSQSSVFDVKGSISQKGLLLTFLLIFIGGLGLNLTPCVYPLIPITVSYFGGQAIGKEGKKIVMAILYVLGIAVINSTLGTIASLSGSMLGNLMANPVVLIVIAGILITLSLSMFGLYEFRLPSSLTQKAGGSQTGYFGSFGMGLTMGIVAAPCIGPFVLGLLTYVASIGDPFLGFSMFFTLSIGLGIPFIFLAFFSSKIDQLPRAGDWMVGVRIIFGLLLLGMALYFLNPVIPDSVFQIVMPLFIIGSGIYLILFNKAGQNTKAFVFIKSLISIVLIMVGTWFLKPEASHMEEMKWVYYSEELYNQVLNGDKPIIMDFYADWCIPCREMDNITFSDPDIVEISKNYTLFKVDITSNTSDEVNKLKEKFDVRGVPTIIFIDSDGKERRDLRCIGFVKPEEFKKKMERML
jgi:thiol:disulfide interchange protein DsbD